jgi:hypothetical protein
VAYSLKAGRVEGEKASNARLQKPKQPAASRQWLCKHVSTVTDHMTAATDRYTMIDKLLEAVFSVGSVQMLFQESLQANGPVLV